MKIAYITAGAGGMYCGSCLHDNTLAAALLSLGHEAVLVPTYTPIHTDEPDVSQPRIFFGGINVYLQEKFSLFRHTPALFDRLFDLRPLLRVAGRFASRTRPGDVADLFLSVLRGEHGHQRKEVIKLARWLANDIRPQIVNLTNVLLSGMVREIKTRLRVPVLATLQGDDIFLEALPQPVRAKAIDLIRENCLAVDGFIATSRYYAEFMAEYLSLPRERIHVVYPGLNLKGHGTPAAPNGRPFTVGYFARICPEKGLHILAQAFRLLAAAPDTGICRLRVSGWLGDNDRGYFNEVRRQIEDWGLAHQFEHVESPDHASKMRFLSGLDALSVPTVYREPKGLYVLEALANGIPVVQPRHGSFPELVAATGGGLLVNPEDPEDLARGLIWLRQNAAYREELGRRGREAVHRDFSARVMAQKTVSIYQEYL